MADTCLFPDDGMGLVILTNKSRTPLPQLLIRHASDRLLGLEPIDWLAEGLDRRKKGQDAEKEAKKKKETLYVDIDAAVKRRISRLADRRYRKLNAEVEIALTRYLDQEEPKEGLSRKVEEDE